MFVEKLERRSIRAAKRAFTTRRVPVRHMRTVISQDVQPQAGDLVLATVDQLGSHLRIELPNGRRAKMFPGDTIVVCYANRYAPDQFEAVVPHDLGPCDLVAGGGVAAREVCRHERMKEPTRIIPVGLVGDREGRPLNVANFKVAPKRGAPRIPVVVVFGTAMNSGKTITAGSLVRSFATAGIRVAGIKATGTGSGGDLWFMKDMGASRAYDFTDAGLASTYLAPHDRIEEGVLCLIDNAASAGCKVAVVEIADGLQHAETAALMESPKIRDRACGVVFAAYDALGAYTGVQTLQSNGYRIFAVSGQITRSPLAVRELQALVDPPVYSPIELQHGAINETHLGSESSTARVIVNEAPLAYMTGPFSSSLARLTDTHRNRPETTDVFQSGVATQSAFRLDVDEDDESGFDDLEDTLAVASHDLPLRPYS